MKKIILSIALLLIGANVATAQQKMQTATTQLTTTQPAQKEESANPKVELLELVKVMELTEIPNNGLYELLEYKAQIMSDKNNSPERKKDFIVSFDEKLQAIVGEVPYNKLRSNKEYYNKLIDVASLDRK